MTLTRRTLALAPVLFAGAVATLAPGASHAADPVNVYSYRESKLIRPLFDAFTEETGIPVNVVSSASGLEQRIATEGASSPADVLLTVDLGRLSDAMRLGITQPVRSAALDAVVPEQFRGPDGHWHPLTMRARVIYASNERVKDTAITYEELADPKWRGKICIRSGQHPYNLALFAAFLARHGEAKTEEWLRGLKANLAKKPSGGDREVARDIAAGTCDIGLGNTYYWALMKDREADKRPWAEATRVILPTFKDGGTHVNVSGIALTKHAPNAANATKLIEWMAGEKAQKMYADINAEYPIRPGVPANPTVASYGPLKPDPTPFAKINESRKAAADLVDKVGFDN